MLQISEILILVLSSLVIMFNTVAMVCLLRNFRRLRQRMYVFIISLTAVEITVGVGYLVDILLKILSAPERDQADSAAETKLTSVEALKCAAVVLSGLNTVVVTYALHKRTTSMGRHRADTMNGEGGGMLHLPAFDTMLRVLSLGQNAQTTPKKQPLDSRTSLQSCSSFSDANADKSCSTVVTRLDGKSKLQSIEQPAAHKLLKQNNGTRYTKTGSLKTQSSSLDQKPVRTMPRITRLLLPKSSWVTNRRPSTNATTQAYIGRHGNSVISIKRTGTLLALIWVVFVIMWITPVAIKMAQANQIISISNSWAQMFTCRKDCNIKTMFPVAKIERKDNASNRDTLLGSGADNFPGSYLSICTNPCSTFFMPLTLLHVSINAATIFISWLIILCSAIRLLWLRKHSNNVFVRCSALWRFIFFAAVFYLATLAPYITICLIDVIRGYRPSVQRYLTPTNTTNYQQEDKVFSLSSKNYLSQADAFYLDVSSCFLLIHCAILPSLYLIRLLGFRRMLSGV